LKIENLKELQKLIALCRKTGVESIKVDNVEFHLGAAPRQASRPQPEILQDPLANVSVPKPNIYNEVTEDTKIITDELTEEQLMYYSARPEAFEDGGQQ
jgi:hypothetical protein